MDTHPPKSPSKSVAEPRVSAKPVSAPTNGDAAREHETPHAANPLAHVARRAAAERSAQGEGLGDASMSIRGFSCWYGDFQALHTISLEIPLKLVTAFIGPSGCGKSTLLRWINRMNDLVPGAHCTGSIMLHKENLAGPGVDVVSLRRRVGMVFQKPNPFPKSIYENIAFGPRLHARLSRSDMDQIVETSLRRAALWDEVKDRLNKSALGLSGGQQQRLCIARAIAVDPEVLLMDEPASALDPKSTARIEDLIRELRTNYTIVIVTHNMQQAARVSDQTAFFFEGKLIEASPTEQIFIAPKQKQTEDYVMGRFG